MSFQVRVACLDDLDDLDALVPLFDGYRQFYGQPADQALVRGFIGERLAHHQSIILLARNDHGEGLGFTQLYPLFSSVRAVRTWLLNDLFVVPQVRRQGVAAGLLRAAAAQARAAGVASLSLSTALTNAPAQALYELLGWQRETQFCDYGLVL